jgi:2-polyprenyl-3-methyl-5-hydroxy-6-metoxy-1,4-benzoquinol methylase
MHERRSTPDKAHQRTVLQLLIRRYLEDNPGSRYLQEHSQPRYIDGHVHTFCDYARYLPDQGDILDWGCHHAPDSCLLKTVYPDRFRLHGCDFVDPQLYSCFHEYAGLEYRQLTEIVTTPYSSGSFDVVIGSGVLEHVAMDYESLKELHRVLKPGGTLIITFLPNRLSANEWVRRVIWKRDFHNRLYGLTESVQLLKRSGFLPLMAAYANGGAWLTPLRYFRSTLMLVAQKAHAM